MLLPRVGIGGIANTSTAFGRLQPALWQCYEQRSRANDLTEDGVMVFEDFDTWGDQVATATDVGGWKVRADTGSTYTQVTTDIGGVLKLDTDATDNDSIDAMYGKNVGNVSIQSGGSASVAFDCRIRLGEGGQVAHNEFFGLTASGSAADNGFFTDAGATADRGCIGFQILEATETYVNFTYKKAGQTAVVTTALYPRGSGGAMESFGFVFDPAERNVARRIKLFINNQEQSTYFTTTQIAAATFPSGVLLGGGFSLKNGSAAANTTEIDLMAWAMSV